MSADFSTFEYENGVVTLSFIENSVRKLIEDNKGADYDIPLNEGKTLSYTGVNLNQSNKISGITGSCWEIKTGESYVINGMRSTSAFSSNFNFYDSNDEPYKYIYAKVLKDCTADLKINLGRIVIECNGILFGNWSDKIGLYRLNASGIPYNNAPLKEWSSTHASNYGIGKIHVTYDYNLDVSLLGQTFIEGDQIALIINTDRSSIKTFESVDTYLEIESFESTVFVDRPVQVCTHEWLLKKILDKIVPSGYTFVWNLPNSNTYDPLKPFVPCLASSSSLAQSPAPVITCNFEKLMMSLRCLYGAGYKIEGSIITIDYPDNFYTNVKAFDVIPINGVKESNDNTNVYNRIVVGYETDADVPNGVFDFNCKNTFTIPSGLTEEKELNLVHPFKGSCYTIEKFMKDKSSDSTINKMSDNELFIFAVHPFLTNTTTLYRTNIIGNDPTVYNVPISPMRSLIANARLIGVSLYPSATPSLAFTSTERNANVSFQCSDFETLPITENDGTGDYLTSILINPLFLPKSIDFQTGIRLWDMSIINESLYKYLELLDKNTNKVYKFWINDLSLRMTQVNSQEFSGIIKEIV